MTSIFVSITSLDVSMAKRMLTLIKSMFRAVSGLVFVVCDIHRDTWTQHSMKRAVQILSIYLSIMSYP